jgi:hypothetical protein
VRITNGEIIESHPRSERKRLDDISDDLSSIPSYAELGNNITKDGIIFDVIDNNKAERHE